MTPIRSLSFCRKKVKVFRDKNCDLPPNSNSRRYFYAQSYKYQSSGTRD